MEINLSSGQFKYKNFDKCPICEQNYNYVTLKSGKQKIITHTHNNKKYGVSKLR